MKIIEMSNDRVRESRDVTAGGRPLPVAKPAAPRNDSANNVLSGVKEPQVTVSFGEEPLALVPPAAPAAAQ